MSRGRNPLDDAPPLRTFYIDVPKMGWFWRYVDTVEVEGHVPQVLPTGALQIVQYKRDIPWTVKFFAPDEWLSLDAEIPSDEDIDLLEAYNTRYGTKQQLMARATKGHTN